MKARGRLCRPAAWPDSGCFTRGRGALSAFGQMLERGEHAALLVRHAGEREAHLDARQRPGEREIVEVAQVPDAENLAGETPQARPERHVVRLEDRAPERVGVVPGGH